MTDIPEDVMKRLTAVWTDFLDANPDDLNSPEDLPNHALMTGEQFVEYAYAALADRAAQAERMAKLEVDAARWNALLRCARIRMQESAGFDPKTGERQQYNNATGEFEKRSDGWVYFEAEFWSIYPGYEDAEKETRRGTVALKALADDVLLKEAEAGHATPGGNTK